MGSVEFNNKTWYNTGMGNGLRFQFDTLPPGMNGKGGLLRSYWAERGRMRNEWRLRVIGEINRKHLRLSEPFRRCRIVYTTKRVRLMDWDNHGASFKMLGDALVYTRVLADDNPKVIMEFVQRQERVKHLKEQGCEVEILEV